MAQHRPVFTTTSDARRRNAAAVGAGRLLGDDRHAAAGCASAQARSEGFEAAEAIALVNGSVASPVPYVSLRVKARAQRSGTRTYAARRARKLSAAAAAATAGAQPIASSVRTPLRCAIAAGVIVA